MEEKEGRMIWTHEYVQIYTNGYGNIVLLFENEKDKPLAIGQKMNEINEDAYMNGYNWDALFRYYLEKHRIFWRVLIAILKPARMSLILKRTKRMRKKPNALPILSYP